MRKQNRSLKIVTDKSGASMVFVLAVMALLMALGTSTLAAAGANAGTGTNKQVSNQLNMYADSMQKAIMFSLQSSEDDEDDLRNNIELSSLNGPETLGGQILGAIYQEAWGRARVDHTAAFDSGVLIDDVLINDIVLTLNFAPVNLSDGGSNTTNLPHSVNAAITASVFITPFAPERPTDEVDAFGNIISFAGPRQPQAAAINGTAMFTVEATVEANPRDKSIRSVAVYDFSGGLLEDNGDATTIGNMLIVDAGVWRLMSHDKADR